MRNRNRLFKEKKPEQVPESKHCNQSTTVTVVVNEKDDGVAECLSGCFSACMGLGKKAAAS